MGKKSVSATVRTTGNTAAVLNRLIRNRYGPTFSGWKRWGWSCPLEIYLFQGLPKGDKMELVIQKAVELGAFQIIPVATRRAVVKLDGKKAQNKCRRWNGISESAAKQSKRMAIPQVTEVMTFAQALEYAAKLDVKLIPYELAKEMKETRRVLGEIKPGQSVGIFIGPEGGFEQEEIRQAMEIGAKPITLGKRILRTETAGMATLAILMYYLEPYSVSEREVLSISLTVWRKYGGIFR